VPQCIAPPYLYRTQTKRRVYYIADSAAASDRVESVIPMSDLPAFDEVHVISDLHMGGRPGFQILRETQRLANFINRLGQRRPQGQVALVLNGDVFDTLAEDVVGYVAVDDAQATVNRIMKDPSFAPIWEALSAFVKLPGRTLVIVIGNHDIEIAFPPVQRLVMSRLAGADLSARARIEFSTAGAGFTCTVGRSRVFCIHGNEVDAWNYNRYEDLAKVSRRMNAGLSLAKDEWKPNAGTRMVKDVMNGVKRTYAWIDLLKPETSAAVGALIVLDPSQAKKINQLFGIVGERQRGDAQVHARLSAEGFQAPDLAATPTLPLELMLGPNLKQGIGEGVDDMLLAAELNFDKPKTLEETDGTLGTPQLVWDRLTGWLTGVSKAEALRRALLDWLEKDKTFDHSDRDDTFKQVRGSVGPAIDFIVTGHTHLERAIDIGQGRYYFNCGTWIRLLRLTPAMLADTKSFDEVYEVLGDGRMKAIDDAVFGGKPFVMDQTSAVSICQQDGQVVGSLTHIEGDGTGAPRAIQSFTRP
jgi:UDP-2,3-diacylglucosamine pyrophosphatase LpxH